MDTIKLILILSLLANVLLASALYILWHDYLKLDKKSSELVYRVNEWRRIANEPHITLDIHEHAIKTVKTLTWILAIEKLKRLLSANQWIIEYDARQIVSAMEEAAEEQCA